VKLFINFCFQSYWRVQPTAARRSSRFNKMHGALRTLHVSLNNVYMRTVRKWLKRNSGHLIISKLERLGFHVWGVTHEAFWNLHPKPKTVSELKVALKKIWDNFLQVQLTKLSRVLEIVWQEYVKGDARYYEHFSALKKVFALNGVWAVLNSWDNF